MIVCVNPRHDHTTTIDREGMTADPPIPMLCNDCAKPTHYDSTIEDYRHDGDSPDDECFLIQDNTGGTPCEITLDAMADELAAASDAPTSVHRYAVLAWLGNPPATETYTTPAAAELVALWRSGERRMRD